MAVDVVHNKQQGRPEFLGPYYQPPQRVLTTPKNF
jgi:hypothetical protein